MIPLIELAPIIRSKNAGPFELTLDVLFRDRASYDRARSSGVLCATTIAELYEIDLSDVLEACFYEPALAFKATMAREPAATVGDTDIFGAQQHMPLLGLMI